MVVVFAAVVVVVYLSSCLQASSLKTTLFCEVSSLFELGNIKNAAILQDFLNLWTWQCQKRSNSVRLPHFSKSTTSKTMQFCEASIKNGKLCAELTSSYQCGLRFFYCICVKCCACHKKMMPGHMKCCACHTKNVTKTEDLMLQNATFLRKSAPWPLNISDEPHLPKCSDVGMFCTSMACKFSSLIWPDGAAPNALANLLLDPPEPQIIGKT